MQSQDAYELAVQGLIRPVDKNIPMVYNIKCIDFTSPEFTLGKCYNICETTLCDNIFLNLIYFFRNCLHKRKRHVFENFSS